MIRIKENIESLNAIREKCKKRQIDFNQEELTHLNLVFIELQESYGKRHVRPLDRSCSSCVLRFMSSVHNYILNEELNESLTFTKTTKKVVTISSGEVEVEQDENEKLTLPELREKYPNVKARSKEKFLRLLNESK